MGKAKGSRGAFGQCEKTLAAGTAWYAQPCATTYGSLQTTREHGKQGFLRVAWNSAQWEKLAGSSALHMSFTLSRVEGVPRAPPPPPQPISPFWMAGHHVQGHKPFAFWFGQWRWHFVEGFKWIAKKIDSVGAVHVSSEILVNGQIGSPESILRGSKLTCYPFSRTW